MEQGCTSRTSVGTLAIEPPPPQAEKKIPLYLVLKGSKNFFGAFGAENALKGSVGGEKLKLGTKFQYNE